MSDDLEHQNETAPTLSDRMLTALFTAPFLSILFLAALLWTGLDYYRQLDQKTWVAVPATLTKVEASIGDKNGYLEVTYTYAQGEQHYTGDFTYTVRQLDFDEERIPTLKAGYEAILNQPDAGTCYVDPSHPDHSVLERATMTRWTVSKLMVALALLGWWMYIVWEAWRKPHLDDDGHEIHTANAASMPVEAQILYPIELPILSSPFGDNTSFLIFFVPMLIIGAFTSSAPSWIFWPLLASTSVTVLAAGLLPKRWARRRYCASWLDLDAAPIAAGDFIQGSIVLQAAIPEGTPFLLQLRPEWDFAHAAITGSGLRRKLEFTGFRYVEAVAHAESSNPDGVAVPIQIPIPKLFTLEGKALAPSQWLLFVHAVLPNGTYKAIFDIPLRSEASHDATDTFLATPYRAENVANYRIEALCRDRIFVKESEDALDIHLPAPRIPVRALLTAALAPFLLLTSILFGREVIGGMIGLGVFFWSLDPWRSSTHLRVTQDAITVRCGLLRRRPRTLPVDPGRGWTTKDDYIGTHLYLHSPGRKTTTLVKWLPDEYTAILLCECIDYYIQTRTEMKEAPEIQQLAG